MLPDLGVVNGGGCEDLNLVCAAEPLKIARLILGVDDTRADETRLVPRLPPSWTGAKAVNWPIHTSAGVVHADIQVRREGKDLHVRIAVADGKRIPKLAIRRGSGGTWERLVDVSEVRL